MKHRTKQYTQKDQTNEMVLMENISSCEYFLYENNESRPVLEDISLLIKKGETWGISGNSAFEAKLLLEILANIRPYDRGRCVLAERGMMRHKRVILKHVFYVGNFDMPYNNMTVLEFLMLAMNRFNPNRVELQHEIFEFIIDIGLGHLSLTLNSMLTKEEKVVEILIAAAYSDSMTIVFNFPDYEFDEILINTIARIAKFIRDRGKSLIISTKNSLLIERACSHTALMADGKILYQGTVENLRLDFDKIVVIVRDKNIDILAERLTPLLPHYRLAVKDDTLLIRSLEGEPGDPGHIYDKIAQTGLVPDYMELNPKTVHNACEEIFFRYDLQKQLP